MLDLEGTWTSKQDESFHPIESTEDEGYGTLEKTGSGRLSMDFLQVHGQIAVEEVDADPNGKLDVVQMWTEEVYSAYPKERLKT